MQGGGAERPAAALVIFGPTGSGKSELAKHLALALGGEIVNADSIQVYRDLSVLSARPGAEACAAVPHHLYGHVDGARAHSAAAWAEAASRLSRQIHAAGRLPILVGGTGLYLATLFDGIAALPEIPRALTATLDQRYRAVGGERFRMELAALDPVLAARLPAGDRQRLVRARAVAEGSGRPLSWWQAQPAKPFLTLPAAGITLLPPREALYRRCDRRLAWMLDAGALDEVRALLARDLSPDLPVMKAVGVPHLASLLRGQIDRAAALAAAQRDTRRYAKRQFTWSRHRGIARAVGTVLELPSAPWAEDWGSRKAGLERFLGDRLARRVVVGERPAQC